MDSEFLVSKRSIGRAVAARVLEAGVRRGDEIGKGFSVAIVDDGGALKAYTRMDNAPLISVQTSQDKAFSAVGARRPTHAWADLFEADPILAVGVPGAVHRMIVFGGGLPIEMAGEYVGGVGASGGTPGEDREVAQAVLDAFHEELGR